MIDNNLIEGVHEPSTLTLLVESTNTGELWWTQSGTKTETDRQTQIERERGIQFTCEIHHEDKDQRRTTLTTMRTCRGGTIKR